MKLIARPHVSPRISSAGAGEKVAKGRIREKEIAPVSQKEAGKGEQESKKKRNRETSNWEISEISLSRREHSTRSRGSLLDGL